MHWLRKSASMNRCALRRSIILAVAMGGAVQQTQAVTIDMVTVGNPGNGYDPITGSVYGSVAYNYAIGKYDVTVGQYTVFLNAVAATDTYSLYNPSMATDLAIAGIARSGASGSYGYSVIGSPNHPITYVSWGDAARFANWLHNGQPAGTEGPGTTETGAYMLNGAVSDSALAAVTRNATAKWFIPAESEWYKAAYYDHAAGQYWTYAIGTYTTPTSAPPGSVPNTANFYDNTTGFAVTGSGSYSSSQNYLTDVGAYAASASPYGTFDQSGNVYQWIEPLVSGSYRRVRGGSWGDYSFYLPSATWFDFNPTYEHSTIGFRVASIPEPSTLLLVTAGIGAFFLRRHRDAGKNNTHKARSNHLARFTVVLALAAGTAFHMPSAIHAADIRTVALSGQHAPGAPDGTNYATGFTSPALNDAGHTAFHAILTGSGVDETNNQGIWSEGSASLALVARTGSPAPGAPSGVNFNGLGSPLLNDAGQTAFFGFDTSQSLWSEGSGSLALVARAGDPAPGTFGVIHPIVFKEFDSLALNNAGHTAFSAALTGISGPLSIGLDDKGAWSDRSGSVALVIRGGGQVPGAPAGVRFVYTRDLFGYGEELKPTLNNAGQIAFLTKLTGSGVNSSNNRGIWSEGSGSLVARSGSQASGTPSGVNFSGFGGFAPVPPTHNDAGQTAFYASLSGTGVNSTNNGGIWSEGSGTLALVARTGGPAPGTPSGVNFSSLAWLVLLNNAGQTAFQANIIGTGVMESVNDVGIWSEGFGNLALVARTGSQAPGTPDGVNFSGFGEIALNDAGQTAFFAYLTGGGAVAGNDQGIWATDPAGVVQLVARVGDPLEVAPGDFRTISQLGFASGAGSSYGGSSGFNYLGQLAFAATFTDSSSGIFVSNRVAVPEPSSLLLLCFGSLAVLWRRRGLVCAYILTAVIGNSYSASARADIFQWEYINPADPSQGKQQSFTIAPEGAGLHAQPGLNASGKVLSMAYLIGANLTAANFSNAYLSHADLSQANLTNTNFSHARLENVILAGAEVRGASFARNHEVPIYILPGILFSQLYPTASYQAHDLTGINLAGNYLVSINLSGFNLSQTNLSNVNLEAANLADANFNGANLTGANVTSVNFSGSNLTLTQLYSTASYQYGGLVAIGLADMNLAGAVFSGKYLADADFSGANLSSANMTNVTINRANLTGANLSGATLTGANVHSAKFTNSNISLAQLYSTASYQDGQLGAIGLANVNLAGAAFSSKSLVDADLSGTNLSSADFSGADVKSVDFSDSNITVAQLHLTVTHQQGNFGGIGLANTDLTGADFSGKSFGDYRDAANFSSANLTQANLTNATLPSALLTNANFTDAQVRGADLSREIYPTGEVFGTGVTRAQLYSTASYKAHDLTGISLGGNSLATADFAGKNLTNARLDRATLIDANLSQSNLTNATFAAATLTNANFTGAEVRGADFDWQVWGSPWGTGITAAQLYSTASYVTGDLTGIGLGRNVLPAANFAGKNLTNARFANSVLNGANLSDANLTGADFSYADLTNANLSQANLTNANFTVAILTGANFAGADVRGANLSRSTNVGVPITSAQLISTASYQSHDLTGINFGVNSLPGFNFANQNLTDAKLFYATLPNANLSQANLTRADFLGANLTGANLSHANLTDANFGGATFTGINLTGADIRGANLSRVVGTQYGSTGACGPKQNGGPCESTPFSLGTGIALAQLYATATYATHDLSEVQLQNNNFNGGNFAGFKLTQSRFEGTTFVGANFSGADVRGNYSINFTGATVNNLIDSMGRIHGLDISVGQLLTVRDYDGEHYHLGLPNYITVKDHFAMGPGGTLQLRFDSDLWDSEIWFDPNIPVSRGGTLELLFAADTDSTTQVGRTIKLFNWDGVSPTGTFNVASPYTWDLSKLYTTGEVTLAAVPEPSTVLLLCFGSLAVLWRRRGLVCGAVL